MLVNVEDNVLNKFNSVCKQYDVSLSTLMKAFALSIIDEQKIPFTEYKSCMEMYNKYGDRIESILTRYDESKRSAMLTKIIDDINLLEKNGYDFGEYARLRLYRFPKEQWFEEYLFDKDTYDIWRTRNPQIMMLYNDKYFAYEKFKEYYKREVITITKIDEADQLIEFAKRHKKIVIKPRYGSLGEGIELCSWRKIQTEKDVAMLLAKDKRGIVAEQCIDQHKDLARYNNNSINTLRVTFIDDQVYYMFRMGTTHHITDSLNRGGLTCGIDADGKILRAYNGAGQKFDRNPYSKVMLTGSIVPDIKEVTKLLSELMHNKMLGAKYVGWDMAKSKDGWCIVELNTKPTVVGLEAALDKGLKKEILLK